MRRFSSYFWMKAGRFLLSLAILLGLQFTIPRLMPGSPVYALLGPDCIGLSGESQQAIEVQMGLNRPLLTQFISHVWRIVGGDLGYSYSYRTPVAEVVVAHLRPTMVLLVPSVLFSSVLALALGALAGRSSGAAVDTSLTSVLLLLHALPAFLTAMVALASFSLFFPVFPLGGLSSVGDDTRALARLIDSLRHLVLPVSVLTISFLGPMYLVMRNSVVVQKDSAYVVYARARGMGEGRILFVHILKNAALPVLSLVGLHFAFMLSGSLLVEIVFSINGMGSVFYEAAVNRDYPLLQGSFFLLTTVALSVNLGVDLLYGLLDPRVLA